MTSEQVKAMMDFYGSGRWTAKEVATTFIPHLEPESFQSFYDTMMVLVEEKKARTHEVLQ